MNSRQEQYKLDQQLMRELRNGKSYETKWYIVNEIGFGDVAAVDTLLPRTRFSSINFIINFIGGYLHHGDPIDIGNTAPSVPWFH